MLQESILPILGLILVFGLAVFVHEFGHMIFALVRGVGVESFAIGMGPKITSWKWKGIDFSLRWFPIGGFVKLQGRTPPPAKAEDDAKPVKSVATVADVDVDTGESKDDKSISESAYDDLYALQDKGFLTKVLVFGGGVFMNYVTAVIVLALLVLVAGINVDLFKPKIEKVVPGSLLAKAGLQAGDQVVTVGKTPVTYYNELREVLIKELEAAGKDSGGAQPVPVTLTVDRGGKPQTLTLPELRQEDLEPLLDNFVESIWRPALIENVGPNTPAEKAGLKKGDEIVAIADKPVNSYNQMAELLSANKGQATPLTFKRQGKEVNTTVTPRRGTEAIKGEDPSRGYIGVVLGSFEKKKVPITNPFKALLIGLQESVARIVSIVDMNANFFKKASMKEVSENVTGPIGIMVITYKMAQMGWENLVNWFINLNLLLMIFNLLPLPVLDGGFILLAVIEGIIRRPVPPKVLGPVYSVFVVGLIILMVLISVQDLTRHLPFFK